MTAPAYGYLHTARVHSIDPVTGGVFLMGVPLAPTSRWGPVATCVFGLQPGDKVVTASLGTSRDTLMVIGKVGDRLPNIGDIPGLVDALAGKADDSEITAINGTLATHTATLGAHATTLGSHTTTLAANGTTLADHTSTLSNHESRIAAEEARQGHIDAVTGTAGRPTTNLYDGRPIYRKDKGFVEFYELSTNKWRVRGCVTVGALADITDPVADQVVFLSTDRSFHRWTGAAWSRLMTGVRTFEAVQSTSLINMTTSFADLTGATVTFTTLGTNSVAMITGTVDGESTGITDVSIMICRVDSTALTGEVHWGPAGRGSYGRSWQTVLADAGNHTIKLEARKTGNADAFKTYANHTGLTVVVYDA